MMPSAFLLILTGDTKTFTFTADKAGDYEVESHSSEAVLMVLRVG
jgi:hypothetical protein